MALAGQIKKARLEHLGYTQRELGNKLGIDPVNVSRWERGETEPRPRYIRELARLSGLPVNWFFEEETEAVA